MFESSKQQSFIIIRLDSFIRSLSVLDETLLPFYIYCMEYYLESTKALRAEELAWLTYIQ